MAVEVRIDGNHLTVTLRGWDKVFALKGRLAFPLGSVALAEAVNGDAVERLPGGWLRLPGTYVPGAIHHGSYGRAPDRDFWAVFRQARVLVVRLEGETYRRLVLGVADPDGDAADVTGAIA
jgi:hypothetical protein